MSLTVLTKGSLRLDGRALGTYADLAPAVTQVTVRETITGASTCTLSVEDPKRVITRSGLLVARTTVVIDGAGFELVSVRRGENGQLDLEFEDAAVAALRRHTGYRKAAAGTVSRVGFCQTLIREESWIKVNAAPGALAKVELARGSANSTATGQDATGTTGGLGTYGLDPKAGTTGSLTASLAKSKAKKQTTTDRKIAAGVEKPEDTWEACGRIMGEIGWRVSAVRKVITIAPDTWILAHGTAYALSDTSPGVDAVSWDYDTGKPAATASLRVRCGTSTQFPVGSRVTLSGEGPADGDWLVETIERTDRDDVAAVDLIRPQPELPEPTAAATLAGLAGLANLGEGGWPDAFDVGGPSSTGTPSVSPLAEAFVQAALTANGKPYKWGASGPDTFDCSGLVQWAAAVAGTATALARTDAGGLTKPRVIRFPKPVGSQLAACRAAGTLLTVQQAISTRGALLIRGPNSHIAISLGNGYTIEARGKDWGCGSWAATGRNWTNGAWVPGIGVAVPVLDAGPH